MTYRRLTATLLALALLAPAAAPAEPMEAPAPVPGVVIIDGAITEETVDAVTGALAAAKTAGVARLTVRINSPGGSVGAGLRIIDALYDSGLPTTCEVGALAGSMAAVLLESYACGERVVRATSLVMFHGVSAGVFGNANAPASESLRAALRAVDRAVAVLIAPRLGLLVDQYLMRIEGKEWWLAGVDALDQGVADRVVPVPAPRVG